MNVLIPSSLRGAGSDAGDRLALGQDRHGRVVAVQSFGSQDMGLDQRMQWL